MPTAKAPTGSIRTKAIKLVRELPSGASWDDLMYRIYVRQKIEAGLSDIKRGKMHSHEAIRREFGLDA